MSAEREIKTAIEKMAGTFKTDVVKLTSATVKSVDEDKATCQCVIDNDVVLENVLLQAGVCDGLLVVPKVDSTVFIISSTYNKPFVCFVSDVDKYYLQVDKSSLEITNDGKIKMNDGSYGGLIKIEELVKKVNALENLINNILTTLKTTTIPLAPSGTYPFAPLYSSFNSIAPITQKSDLENADITHGKPAS